LSSESVCTQSTPCSFLSTYIAHSYE